MKNWSELLPDILYLICDRVVSFEDTVAFGGVCSTWRHVAIKQNLDLPLLPFPWLMLAENKNDDLRDFYSVTERKTYSFDLPELKGKKCMETKGWIVTASDKGEMVLIHPLARVQIPLPHLNTSWCFDEYEMDPLLYVQRVVLSSPPDPKNEKDCVLVILHGCLCHVGFCRPGDKVWTVVDNLIINSGNQSLEYYRGKFYVTTNDGDVVEYDIIGKSKNTSPVSPRRINVNIRKYLKHRQSYLVKSGGSLLVVIRDGVNHSNYGATDFWVLEINVERGRYKRMMSLGTRAIFVGHSAPLSVDASRYPELITNSIYFTDDCVGCCSGKSEGGAINMGVYNLEDKSLRSHYNGKSLSLVCPPVWTFLTIK